MMPISRALVDSANAFRVRRRGEIETYSRLEWGGRMGSLELLGRSHRPRSDWLHRLRAWARRPAHRDQPVPARASPVVVHRVRIEPDIELLVSLATPALAGGTGFRNATADPRSPIPAELVVGEHP